MGYVYLLCQVDAVGQETFKIGISKNDPAIRLKNLQTGNPNKISVLKQYESENYKNVEKLLHRKYHANKTLADNEWFSLSNEDVNYFIFECEKANNMIIFLKENNHFCK